MALAELLQAVDSAFELAPRKNYSVFHSLPVCTVALGAWAQLVYFAWRDIITRHIPTETSYPIGISLTARTCAHPLLTIFLTIQKANSHCFV